MNSILLRRLFRAIAERSEQDIREVSKAIIDEERTKGHMNVADQLLETLQPYLSSDNSGCVPTTHDDRALRELPISRRYNEALVTLVPRPVLQHHMVLATEIEQRFLRIEREFAARERLAHYSLPIRRKILIYGHTGCGKSMGAERLAWSIGLPLMKVRFDSIISSYFGESAANLRAVFDASQKTACVLLLDECDFIARSRLSGQDVGEAPRIVNAFLQLLDDYVSPGLLVATTNVKESLDKALFRRFDDVFEIPLPGPEEIRRLLKMSLSSVRVGCDIDWDEIITRLSGFSAANVISVGRSAAKECVLFGEEIVRRAHLENAVEEMKVR